MLYFNPWATGAAGAGLPAVSLAHRPVYLTSHGPAGKSTLLRLLLARTKLRQAKGVAALLSPTSTEDDEANAALRASGAATSEDPVAPTMASGGAARRSSASLPTAPAAPAPPVKPAFLPFLTTHWVSMPRTISAASFQVRRRRQCERGSWVGGRSLHWVRSHAVVAGRCCGTPRPPHAVPAGRPRASHAQAVAHRGRR